MTFGAGAFAIVGNTFAGWLSDRIGRKKVTMGFLIGQVTFTIAYYNVPALFVIPSWILMIFTLLGVNVVLAAYGSELFPTSYRSTAAGVRIIIATVGGSIGLMLESVLYGVYQSHWPAISTLVLIMLFTPVLVALVFPETSGRTLEDMPGTLNCMGRPSYSLVSEAGGKRASACSLTCLAKSRRPLSR